MHPAFLGSPDLAAWLREQGYDGIAVCGITTSHCCETTAQAGSDIGFDVLFVLDPTHAFDSGGLSADELARATAANLQGEFATVVATADLVGARPPSGMRTAPVAGTVSGSRRQLTLRAPNASLS